MGSLSIRLVAAVLATATAGAVMYALRLTAQVRSLPERLLEWLLILVSPQVFEDLLLRFGYDAKRYALWALSLGLGVVLAALGFVALSRGWSSRLLLILGIVMWASIMVVVMPLTSAGAFATDLIAGAWNAVLGYVAVCLAYASVLAVGRLAEDATRRRANLPAASANRRAAFIGVGTALAAFFAANFLPVVAYRSESRPTIILDPQEPVPAGGLDPPSTHPEAVASASESAVPVEAEATSTPTESTVVTAQFPEPRAARSLKRDADGAVLPAGRRKGELTDLITSNDDFYVVTKNAAGDPFLKPADWRLLVDGEVEQRVELGYAALRALPSVETTKTLECISNLVSACELAPFGCDLISNARWRGVRLVDVLQLAGGVKPDAVSLTTISADEYTTEIPIQAALDPDTLVVYEMNGEVLPREHGYPVRLLVPGRYGMKNAKWLIGLRPTRREVVDWYGQRHWSKSGVVRTMTRIDVPMPETPLPAGDYNVAGIAYAGDRGVRQVEFSMDGGETWHEAELIEGATGRDTWVRWIGRFTLGAGASLTLTSRATDGTGTLQTEEFQLAQPDGSTGWHRLEVTTKPG